MNRNRGVDCFRATALLTMMLYHCWVLTGSWNLQSSSIQLFVMLGGEIGVTGFFLLSGYGIYCSLEHKETDRKYRYLDYLKHRAIRICPEYYLVLIVCILIVNATYLSSHGVKDILTHIFFIHNFFPQFHGGINGALWTMGVIVQFYLVAPILYRLMRKYGVCFLGASIIFTIGCKALVYKSLLPYIGHAGEWEFVMGRQLFTALDNFTIGMFVARLINDCQIELKKYKFITTSFVGIFLMFCVLKLGAKFGIHTNNISGYTWHTILAGSLGFLLWNVGQLKSTDNFLLAILQWLSKHEYGIYLWHMTVLNNLLNNSEWVHAFLIQESKVIYILLLICAILVGYIFSVMVNAVVKSYYAKG